MRARSSPPRPSGSASPALALRAADGGDAAPAVVARTTHAAVTTSSRTLAITGSRAIVIGRQAMGLAHVPRVMNIGSFLASRFPAWVAVVAPDPRRS